MILDPLIETVIESKLWEYSQELYILFICSSPTVTTHYYACLWRDYSSTFALYSALDSFKKIEGPTYRATRLLDIFPT